MSDMSANYPFLAVTDLASISESLVILFKGFNLDTVLNFHFQVHEAKLPFALNFIVHFV